MRLACVVLALALPSGLFADTVVHFVGGVAPGQFPFVGTLLDNLGIGSSNVASETTALTFAVPGVSGTTDLTFTYQFDGGGFAFTFGFYPVSAVAGVDPIADKVNYAIKALTAATTVFDDNAVDPVVSNGPFSLTPGTVLGFFIVPNDTVANFLADPNSYYDPPANSGDIFANKRSPLFSVSDANPGELDQLLSFVGNGVTLFTFEDLTRIDGGGSDQDFEDIAFTIDAELNPVVNRPPDCSAAALSATGCWPPNHKFTVVNVTGVTDPDGDPVSITITGITQDEAVKETGKGSGSTCPDGALVDTNADGIADAAALRCERDGTGNGRVYSVQFTASDGKGGACTGSATFCVVHDQRPGATCVDDGQKFDSTGCAGTGAGGANGTAPVLTLDEVNALTPEPLFLRADVNWDESLDISDGIRILNGLFLEKNLRAIDCADAADANDDGEVDLSDAVTIFAYLYSGSLAPPAPLDVAGVDPTMDALGCE